MPDETTPSITNESRSVVVKGQGLSDRVLPGPLFGKRHAEVAKRTFRSGNQRWCNGPIFGAVVEKSSPVEPLVMLKLAQRLCHHF